MEAQKDFIIRDGVLEKYVGKGGRVIIPNGVEIIASYAFSHCEEITSVVIPMGVVSIGREAFSWCLSLGWVIIPESVERIETMAFAICPELEFIDIPKNLKSAGRNILKGCKKLRNRAELAKFFQEPEEVEAAVADSSQEFAGQIGIKGAPSPFDDEVKCQCPPPETVSFPDFDFDAEPSAQTRACPPPPTPSAQTMPMSPVAPTVSGAGVDRRRSKEGGFFWGLLKKKKTPKSEEPKVVRPQSFEIPGMPQSGEISFCPNCGGRCGENDACCPTCGNKLEENAPKSLKISRANFSAVVPQKIIKGEYATVNITMFEDECRNIVESIIENSDRPAKEIIGSPMEIKSETKVRIKLTSPELELSDCDETRKWIGGYLNFEFPIAIPREFARKQIMFTAHVYFNDVIATRLRFTADCTSVREQKLELMRDDVLSAFISYASQDRELVAKIFQGMKKARPDMDIFFDVDNLRSGDNWEETLRAEIEKRDILYLCWSRHAKESEWVDKEWRYALANNGMDSIEPIPLVSPAECPPPDELSSKHFNDRALLY